MLLKEETRKIQEDLARYCRDGQIDDIKGADPERLTHYRRLVYNVLYGLLEKAFPITKSVIEEEEFKNLIQEFLSGHLSGEPQAWKVPGEFFAYFKNNKPELADKYPYLLDLLLMEWTEILVHNREDRLVTDYEEFVPEKYDKVVLNPDREVIELQYPVYKGDWPGLKEKKGNYYLLIYRHRETKKVHFLEINMYFVLLLVRLEGDISIHNAIMTIVEEFKLALNADAYYGMLDFAIELYERGMSLGTDY